MLMLTACKRDVSITKDTTVVQQTKKIELVNNWLLSELKTSQGERKTFLEKVTKLILWDRGALQANDLYSTIVIPLKSPNSNIVLTVSVNDNSNQIDSAEIQLIRPLKDSKVKKSSKGNIDNHTILDEGFSGIISSYTLSNRLKYVRSFLNGKLISTSKQERRERNSLVQLKVNTQKSSALVCWDTYWVTFNYDGTQTWNYMYSSCSDDCNTTSILDLEKGISIKNNCGGGGTGPSGQELVMTPELQQFEYEFRNKMSQQELQIFDNELTPYQKLIYLANAKSAILVSERHFPGTGYNGKGDAMRHSLFVALNSNALGSYLASRLASAHEQRGTAIEIDMDTRNNQRGLYHQMRLMQMGLSPGEFADMLIVSLLQDMQNGSLFVISNLGPDGAPTASSQVVAANQ